jgi:magnesium-transporting ATPase (P-type)
MYAAVFSSFAIVTIALALAALAFPWWAAVDVASRPKESFASTELPKRAWLVLLIVFTVFTYFVGLGLALNYALKARPTMPPTTHNDKLGHRLLRSTTVVLLMIVSFAITYGFTHVQSLWSSNTPHAIVEGHLRGHCVSEDTTSEGSKLTVKLTTGYSKEVVGLTSIAGRTGRTSFSFDVTPGTYRLTATSASTSQRWGLSFAGGVRSSPRIVPTPVTMNVPVSVAC